MNQVELAARLAAADDHERNKLLARWPQLADASLAWALKDQVYDAWNSDPARATAAATALAALAALRPDPVVRALSIWTSGIVALTEGQMELSVARLDQAAAQFDALDQPHSAAATQVSKLIPLAMLGRYDEAIAAGLHARDVFLAHDDLLAAGRIEHNLGNIYWRRDQYAEAERFLRAARERFAAAGDQRQLAKIDDSLAFTLALQHKFRAAAALYEQALASAEATGLTVTQAEIECSLGNLALLQGRYDRALDYLERSRRRYAALGMPHESSIAEQELADAYLELNLAPEAAAIYTRVIPTFEQLGVRAERARALVNYGRACLLLGEGGRARDLLAQAGALYAAEGNSVGAAMVTLAEAQLFYVEGDHAAAAAAAARAEPPLAQAGARGRLLLARWLRADAARALGHANEARGLLEAVLRDATRQRLPHLTQRCHTSLGLLAAASGDRAAAEAAFIRAVEQIENLRAPLPAEEFRTAFVADKLAPYVELTRLCLDDPRGGRVAEALGYVERARSRALAERLGGALPLRQAPADPFEAELLGRLEELREELNWFYSQLNRPPDGELARGSETIGALNQAALEREAVIAEINRQLHQRHAGGDGPSAAQLDDLPRLQQELGADTALVEYFGLNGELIAFVLTDAGVEVARGLAREEQVEAAVAQLRFQIDSLRYGAERLRRHLAQLGQRVDHYLGELYNLLLRPLEAKIGERRLVVVPHRALHYVPFHALFDGQRYLIERREVSYAPSASVLQLCLARPRRPLDRALLLGVPDEQTPRVRDEVAGLAPLFPSATALLGEHATLAALRHMVADADVLHLACHGWFRPDNPLFSSLRLADGWLTVRDAYSLALRCELVTLSACETGASAVAAGDELIGIARGFFATGTPSLLVSLWTVDDDTTATLMHGFYARLCRGVRPAAALREAQRELLEQHPHSFFWSPFVLLGRW